MREGDINTFDVLYNDFDLVIFLYFSIYLGSNFEIFPLFSGTKLQTLEYHLKEGSHNPYMHLFNFHAWVDG